MWSIPTPPHNGVEYLFLRKYNMRLYDIVESFDTSVKRTSSRTTSTGSTVSARIGNRNIVYMAHILTGFENEKIAMVEFFEKDINNTTSSYDITGSGNQMQVFSFVIDCVKDTIIDFDPDEIKFTAVKSDGNRGRLYTKIASRIPGYVLKNIDQGSIEELYTFVKKSKLKDAISESLNSEVNGRVRVSRDDLFVTQALIGERKIEFSALEFTQGRWTVEFTESNKKGKTHELTGSGNELQVLSFVVQSLNIFMKKYNPSEITFSAAGRSRFKAYQRIFNRMFSKDYNMVVDDVGDDVTVFVITRKNNI